MIILDIQATHEAVSTTRVEYSRLDSQSNPRVCALAKQNDVSAAPCLAILDAQRGWFACFYQFFLSRGAWQLAMGKWRIGPITKSEHRVPSCLESKIWPSQPICFNERSTQSLFLFSMWCTPWAHTNSKLVSPHFLKLLEPAAKHYTLHSCLFKPTDFAYQAWFWGNLQPFYSEMWPHLSFLFSFGPSSWFKPIWVHSFSIPNQMSFVYYKPPRQCASFRSLELISNGQMMDWLDLSSWSFLFLILFALEIEQ